MVALLLVAASGVGAGSGSAQPARERSYSVRVCARLRPLPPDEASAPGAQQRKPVVLPLHQRLQLLRASQHCNQTDAQRRLWESRGGLADPYVAAAVKVPRGDDADVEMDATTGGWREKEEDGAGVSACVLSSAGGQLGTSSCAALLALASANLPWTTS